MKKVKKAVIAVSALLMTFGVSALCACTPGGGAQEPSGGGGKGEPEHTHNYGTDYITDSTHHWKECQNADCDEKVISSGLHGDASDDGKCDVCGYIVDEVKGKYLEFELQDDGTYTVLKISDDFSGSLTIPTTYKNVNVTSIGKGVSFALGYPVVTSNSKVTEITVPNTVKSIRNSAFLNCSSLKEIAFGENLETIGEFAFSNCVSLKEVDIPDKVTIINDNTFSGCSSLETVSLGYDVFVIANQAFNGCTSLKNVTLGESVKSIGVEAFYGCAIKSIDIPATLTELKGGAFGNCDYLLKINFKGTTSQWQSAKGYAYKPVPSQTNVICEGDAE